MLGALALAESAGAKAVEPLTGDVMRMIDPDGRPVALATLAFAQPEHEAGAPDDVQRLISALESALGRWPFLLYLRRAVPAGFDPKAVAQAVQLWKMALERGDWRGSHAVYEDDDIAIELSVTPPLPEDQPAKVLVAVPPLNASDRLAIVYRRLLAVTRAIDAVAPGMPIVPVLVVEPRWRLPRGHVLEALYGLADRIETDANGYRAVYRPSGLSLFSDSACRKVAAIWWAECASGDPLAMRSWAHESPWCSPMPRLNFPGPRFEVERAETGLGAVVMRWSESRS